MYIDASPSQAQLVAPQAGMSLIFSVIIDSVFFLKTDADHGWKKWLTMGNLLIVGGIAIAIIIVIVMIYCCCCATKKSNSTSRSSIRSAESATSTE